MATGLLGLVVMCAPAAAQRILTDEPKPGTLRAGDRVLVDDHSCPAGQIKEVSAGQNVSLSGHGTAGNRRRHERCIAR